MQPDPIFSRIWYFSRMIIPESSSLVSLRPAPSFGHTWKSVGYEVLHELQYFMTENPERMASGPEKAVSILSHSPAGSAAAGLRRLHFRRRFLAQAADAIRRKRAFMLGGN